ncbi:MAG TPA: TonB-dependent receptor [Candidatus Acidoferrum sp.]|nr:TonB-dependent receptor [Candidatus Acidoferrum sp.]
MKMKQLRSWALALLIVLSTAAICAAQSDTARLQGTVTDPQGNAVSGAAVNVTSVETGRLSTVTTSELGYYTVSALPPGNYRVDISQKGFKKVSRTLELQVAQLGVADFQLSVGEVTETITVEGGSPVINSQDSAIGEVVESSQITQLPLNGRNFTQLATLVPGVTRGVPTGSNSATGVNNNAETFRFGQEGGASLAVNGLRPQANNFILDGIDNNESLVNTIVFFPPAEAIDEFKVQTSVAPAEFGRAGGALVVTSIKAGTNDIHGSAFWYNRNTNLNAKDFFSAPNSATPGFNRNQFGGTLGMPIWKNKLFVFGDYEGLRLKQPSNTGFATVPTDAMRNGDFTELLCGGAATCPASTGISTPVVVLDPTTGSQFVAFPTGPNANSRCTNVAGCPNMIPTARINTVGQNYLNIFPEPNCTHAENATCGSLFDNYTNTAKIIENWNDFDIRTDYIINSTNSLFGRFSRGRTDQTHTTLFPTIPSCAGFGCGTNFNHPYGASIGLTSTFGGSFVNEARVGFVRTYYGYLNPFNSTDFCTQLGIVNCNTPLLGGIALIGGYNSQLQYTGDGGPYLIPQTGFDYSDSLTWNKGRHTVKFGGTVIRRQLNLFRGNNAKGYFGLAGNGSGCCAGGGAGHINTDYEVSDILAGFVDGYQHGVPLGTTGTRSWENGFFVQDDFRVTQRLTLNLGLRWDILTWPVEVNDRQANFDLNTGALIVAGSNGASRTLIPNDYHDFGPRLGFAYQLTRDGKTVVRGGYGLFYYIDRGGIANQLAQNPPFAGLNSASYFNGARITLSGSLPCEPNCTQAQLIATNATGPLPSGNFTNLNLANPTGVSVIADLPTNVPPQISQWNLQIQREIAVNQSVSIAYVGTHGAHLTRNYNANQPLYTTGDELFPNLGGSITVQDTRGKSDYNSLQLQYERRMTKGLQFLGAFTWSKTTDDACGAIDTCQPQLYTDFKLEHALSNQDQPYRLVLSSLYELPFGKGKRWANSFSRPVDMIVGGWQITGIYTLQAGQPFSVTVSNITRADLIGKPTVDPGNLQQYFNIAAFANPAKTASGVYIAPGTSGRDILRGPGSSNIDVSLFKNFDVTERVKARFILEAYNLTNTPHFANPNSSLTGGGFGEIQSTIPFTFRQLELGLKVTF